MKKTIRILALLLCLCMVTGIMFGCSKDTSNGTDTEPEPSPDKISEEDKYGGVLNFAMSNVPGNCDPVKYTTVYESDVLVTICDTLVIYDKEFSKILPNLATEWSSNEAGDAFTFKLRDDVYFQKGKYQDGRQMTAEDVKYSLERSERESAMNRLDMLDHCEVVNDFEIICYLKGPNGSFLTALTNSGNVIVPKEEVEGWGDEFGNNLVGTGPFKMKEYIPDLSCEVERNENYWGPKPYLDGVKFFYITDSNARVNALRAGDIHIANDLKGSTIEMVKNDPNLVLSEVEGMRIMYMSFNMEMEPTNDIRVRKAMMAAVDFEEVANVIFKYGDGKRAYLPLQTQSWGYDPSLESVIPEYNPEEAKKLLAEAGYPDGFDITFVTSERTESIQIGTIFQQYMKKNLNINVILQTQSQAATSEITASGKAQLSYGGWTWYTDPYFYLNKLFHSNAFGTTGNGQHFSNPEVDRLLDEAVALSDQDERAKLYKQALKIIVEQYPRMIFGQNNIFAGMSSDVQDYEPRGDNSVSIASTITNTWLKK